MDFTTGTLAIAGLFGALAASPLVAQDAMSPESMTCADFMAMDSEGQMQAMDDMQMASSDDMMAEGEDGMATDEAMSEGEGSVMSEGDGMMDDHMAAMSSACEGNPEMMAMDAMMSAMDQ